MSLTYEEVQEVINKPPENRTEREVTKILPWFQKQCQSKILATIHAERLMDIIKNLQFVTMKQDDIIIKQGDRGDCMYIILRGQVTIYMLYAKAGDEEQTSLPVPDIQPGVELRSQLGTFVVQLGPGAAFGEVALMNDDECIRTATCLADNQCDLIVVDRVLFKRSAKYVVNEEFEFKSNFIRNYQIFAKWAPKYKKQLTMALEKENYAYDHFIQKQGQKVDAIYFIVKGEAKLTMDVEQHRNQYPNFLPETKKRHDDNDDDDDDDMLRLSVSERKRAAPASGRSPKRTGKKVKKLQEICLLGVNEPIGDIETLLGLSTYIQSASCTQPTDVLVLGMKHYNRLFVKRNPKTILGMKERLEFRLRTRMRKPLAESVPLLKALCDRAKEDNEKRQQQLLKQQQNEAARVNSTSRTSNYGTNSTRGGMSVADSLNSFLPPRGLLVDINGPGTVFHRIRERRKEEERKERQKKRLLGDKTLPQPVSVLSSADGIADFQSLSVVEGGGGEVKSRNSRVNEINNSKTRRSLRSYENEPRQPSFDRFSSDDPALENLESRLKAWIINDRRPSGDEGRVEPIRIEKLHRAEIESEHLKPGGVLSMRNRQRGINSTDILVVDNA